MGCYWHCKTNVQRCFRVQGSIQDCTFQKLILRLCPVSLVILAFPWNWEFAGKNRMQFVWKMDLDCLSCWQGSDGLILWEMEPWCQVHVPSNTWFLPCIDKRELPATFRSRSDSKSLSSLWPDLNNHINKLLGFQFSLINCKKKKISIKESIEMNICQAQS